MTAGVRRWWRRLRSPRHTVWPTRDGWWCLFVALGLGLAAVNTGNNLVYLLCSMLLALVLVSGVLSELSLRGLALTPVLPQEIYAGRPALFGAVVANRKRWAASHSIAVEVLGTAVDTRVFYLPRLEGGADRLCTWEAALPARGRHRLPGVRVTTRFPFGLFLKAGRARLDAEVLVYPAVGPIDAELLSQVGGTGDAGTRRRGRGADLYNLRPYRAGDDPRLIHWRVSAKAQALTVRELEEDSTQDTRIVLEGTGAGGGPRLERGLSQAASLAVHLLRGGASVALVGPGVRQGLGRGRAHETRLLTALALYDPTAAATGSAAGDPGHAGLREIRVALG